MGRKEVKQEVARKKFYRCCPKYKKEFAFFQYRKRLNRKIECVKNPMRLQKNSSNTKITTFRMEMNMKSDESLQKLFL